MSIEASLVAHRGMAFDANLAASLRTLASEQAAPASVYVRAARQLGEMHATLIGQLRDDTHGKHDQREPLDLVVAHGQTIWHDGDARMSWQLMDPWPIAHRLGVKVCHDLRQADLIAGGHGAPITPLADWIMYRTPDRSRLIVNLGGICNVTWLPDAVDAQDAEAAPEVKAIRAGDVGPCNLLIDGVVRRLVPEMTYDRDGALSQQGAAIGAEDDRMKPLLTMIDQACHTSQTLGREQFDDTWLNALVGRMEGIGSVHDRIAMAVVGAAHVVAGGINKHEADEVILCGGGARNPTLVEAIRASSRRAGRGCSIGLSDELGVPCEAREAMAMAVLGVLAGDGVRITLPQVTGGKSGATAGTWVG